MRGLGRALAFTAWCLSCLPGCTTPKELHYFGEADLQHYKQEATTIDYPDVNLPSNDSAVFSQKPHTVRDPLEDENVWPLSLLEAIHLAIANSRVIRSRQAFKSPVNQLMASPERVASTYDAAIQESSTNFFARGPEAALSAFDAQLQVAMNLGRDQIVQNNALLAGGLFPGNTLQNDNASFQSSLSKIIATGGTFQLSHNWSYLANNVPFQLFPSYYRVWTRADFRQPLLAGAGTEFSRIAGPSARMIPGISIIDQGVLIARINTDITLADFEASVTNLVKDVEDQYWELALAYRTLNAEKKAQHAAHSFWQTTKRRLDVGAFKGSALDEGQARENYFNTRARVENAVANLYTAEGLLRRMLGLPVNDGRFIRPSDEPLSAEYVADWQGALLDSLTRRVELRRQKWQIKSLELQLRAAENLVRPRLDFVGGYQVNGFGDNLFRQNIEDGSRADRYHSAYDTMSEWNQTSWDVGFQFTLPVGLRQALAQKRNVELRLMKARAVLAAQELEISHELGNTFGQIDAAYQLAETNLDRYLAAERQLEVVQREYDAGRISIDLVLRTQANAAAAETAYYTALTRYNQAIADLRLRKGTLLEENNIILAEGDWTPEAKEEALRRAWARSFAKDADHLGDSTEPFALPAPTGAAAPAMMGSDPAGVWPAPDATAEPTPESPSSIPPVPAPE